MAKSPNRYGALIEKIFFDRYSDGATELEFARTDIEDAAEVLDIMDVSRFDAAPLIAFIAAKEMNYGTETNGRIPR